MPESSGSAGDGQLPESSGSVADGQLPESSGSAGDGQLPESSGSAGDGQLTERSGSSGDGQLRESAFQKKLDFSETLHSSDSDESISDKLEFSSVIIPIDMLNIMFTNSICTYCHEHSLRASAVKNEGLVAKIQVMCGNCDKRMEFWAGERMKPEENATSTFIPLSLNRRAVRGAVESYAHHSGMSQLLASLYLPNIYQSSYRGHLKQVVQHLNEVSLVILIQFKKIITIIKLNIMIIIRVA